MILTKQKLSGGLGKRIQQYRALNSGLKMMILIIQNIKWQFEGDDSENTGQLNGDLRAMIPTIQSIKWQ